VKPLDLGEKLVKASQTSSLFKKLIRESIFCDRCCKLNANDLSNQSILQWQKNLQKVDKSTMIRKLFKRIGRQTIVLLVLDVNDVNGSYPEKEVIKHLNEKDVRNSFTNSIFIS
jgi:hypothetical protein